MTLPLVCPLLDNTILILIPVSKAEEGNYESYNLQGVYLLYTVFLLLLGWGLRSVDSFVFFDKPKNEIFLLYDN